METETGLIRTYVALLGTAGGVFPAESIDNVWTPACDYNYHPRPYHYHEYRSGGILDGEDVTSPPYRKADPEYQSQGRRFRTTRVSIPILTASMIVRRWGKLLHSVKLSAPTRTLPRAIIGVNKMMPEVIYRSKSIPP